MLKIKDAPQLVDSEPRITYWLGDPAIDAESSDVSAWAETADSSALSIRPGQMPSAIEWRQLRELELNLLPMATTPGTYALRLIKAAQIGIVKIEGVDLRRTSEAGFRLISLAQAQDLVEQIPRARLPFWRTLRAMDKANTGIHQDVGDEEVDLFQWLGAVILGHSTFR
jgi:hypothetical protein